MDAPLTPGADQPIPVHATSSNGSWRTTLPPTRGHTEVWGEQRGVVKLALGRHDVRVCPGGRHDVTVADEVPDPRPRHPRRGGAGWRGGGEDRAGWRRGRPRRCRPVWSRCAVLLSERHRPRLSH